MLNAPVLTNLSSTSVTVSGGAMIPLRSLVSFANGSLTANTSSTIYFGPVSGPPTQGVVIGTGSMVTFGGTVQINSPLVNYGVVTASGSLNLTGSSVTNTGAIVSTGGGSVTVDSATNYAGGTLTGGTWEAIGNSVLRVIGANISANAATILLDGAGSAFYSDTGTTSALAGLTSNTAGGRLTIQNGFNLTVPAGFTNAGDLTVGPGSTLIPSTTYIQTAGTTQLQAGAVASLHPPVGNALSFDDNNDVTVPDATSLRPASLTLEGWVNFASLPSGVLSLFGKPLGNASLDSYAVWYYNGNLYGGIANATNQYQVAYGWTPTPNTWYHVASTFDATSGNEALYVNGALVASGTANATIAYDTHPLLLGADIDDQLLRYFLPGQLSSFSLWSTARSHAQIQSDMNQGLTGTETGLAAYLPLNEGSGTTVHDLTVNGNNGTLGGGVAANQPAWVPLTLASLTGPSGSLGSPTPPVAAALSFNGTSDFVQVPSSPTLDSQALTTQATYEAYVYLNQLPSSVGHIMEIMAKSESGNDLDLQVETDNRVHFYAGDDFPDSVTSNTALQTGKWYFIAATYQAGNPGLLQIFINGALDASQFGTFARSTNPNPLTIGESYVWPGRFFNGLIDDVSVWNVAETQAQIQAEMNVKLPSTESGLVAYWPLNEAIGTTTHDLTGNGNNGLLGNGVTADQPSWVVNAQPSVNLEGGTLTGSGVINGNVANSAAVSPGGVANAGTLSVTGSYTQTSGGSLNVAVGGLTAGSQYDQLNVAGTATLGGTLNASLINGFVPPSGQVFNVLTFASSSGAFSTFNSPQSNGTTVFVEVPTPTSVNLQTALTTTVTVTDPSGTYNGSPFTASATASADNMNISSQGTLTFTYYVGPNTSGSVLSAAPSSAGNYTVVAHFQSNNPALYASADSSALTFIISPVTLTVTGIVANNKTYDGTTAATLNLTNATLVGVLNGDTVTLNSSYTATFASASVGSSIPVTVSGLTLGGAQSPDFTLTQPTGLIANILAPLVPGQVSIALDPGSDSGVKGDDLTNVTTPTFDVTVNEAGTILVDYKGDGTATATLAVSAAGTYQFTAPTLADGTYTTKATFTPTAESAVTGNVTITIDTKAPTLLTGSALENGPLYTRTLTFSKDIDATTIGAASVLVSGPGITGSVDSASVIGSGTTYTVTFATPLTQGGAYTLQLAASIADLAGNPLGSGVTDTFTLNPDTTPPVVASVTPSGLTNANVSSLTVTFDKAIDASTFTPAKVVITTPGGPIPTASITVSEIDAAKYAVSFPQQTQEATYDVGIGGPGVLDISGNAMTAAYQTSFTIDRTAPTVVSSTPTGTINDLVDQVDVTFSKLINVATLNGTNLSLTGPDGAVSVGQGYLLSGTTYGIPFAAQRANGAYQFTVGAGVQDLAGNPLGAANVYQTTFTVSLPDLVVTSVLPSTFLVHFGDTLNLTWTVSNDGTAAATGPWTDDVFLSTTPTLAGAIYLGSYTAEASRTLAPIASYNGQATVTLPVNAMLTAGTYYVVVQADAAGAVNESDLATQTMSAAIAPDGTAAAGPERVVGHFFADGGATGPIGDGFLGGAKHRRFGGPRALGG